MRISTSSAFTSGVTTLQKRQTELAEAQQRLTSGKRVAKASDDPAAAARAERALASELRADTAQRSVNASRIAMEQTESAFADAAELLLEARDAVVAGGNATYSDKERAGLAEKIRALRDQLLVVANRTDGGGVYLFGGQGATTQPFVDGPGGVSFVGVAGYNTTDAGTGLPLTTDGNAAWMATPASNNASVFGVLDRAVAELSTANRTTTQISQTTGQNLADIDAVLNNQQSMRAATGEVLRRIDGDTSRLADQKLASQTERSDAEDLDMVQAVSDFQNKQTGYDAALKAYSMVQRLSLFQYLNG